MGFETCRMTCEDTLETAVKDMAEGEVTSSLYPKCNVLHWEVTGSGWSRVPVAPPKSRGEEIARRAIKTQNEWVNIEWAPQCVTCFKQHSPRVAVDLADRVGRLIDQAIAEEREAYANEARSGNNGHDPSERIATAIRARSNHNE